MLRCLTREVDDDDDDDDDDYDDDDVHDNDECQVPSVLQSFCISLP